MARGGVRPGAGRPSGSANKRNTEMAVAAAHAGLTPLDYMLSIVRDEGMDRETRLDAAKSAAPYCHARLAAVEVGGRGGGNLVVEIVRFSDQAAGK